MALLQGNTSMKDANLWNRIAACHPDAVEADFPFSKRLARDNGWSHGFALRVITEYQRFAYLSRLGSGMVTPSDEVDQAWHLHLTYTKHYWGPFKDALGGPLHHMPTKGGADQNALFNDAYAKTLAHYRSEFGEPPADIWPPASVRFGKAPHFQRLNTQDHWIIAKPKWSNKLQTVYETVKALPGAVLGAGAALIAFLLGSSLAFAHGSPAGDTLLERVRNMIWHWATEHTIVFVLCVALVGFVLLALFKKATGGKSSGCGSGCTAGGASGCSSSGCGGCGD